MKCPDCKLTDIIKNGFRYRKNKPFKIQKYVCSKCFKSFTKLRLVE